MGFSSCLRGIGVSLALSLIVVTVFAGRPDDQDDVEHILNIAATHYSDGELEQSLLWLARAHELIIEEMEQTGDLLESSNAAQLLNVLDLYGHVACGHDPELDAEYETISALLTTLYEIELHHPRPSHSGDLSVHTYADGLVHRFGDIDVGHWRGGQIHRIGDFDIGYWADGKPHRIGSIDISYRADGTIHRIGGVDID